jgi:hypothetical protein
VLAQLQPADPRGRDAKLDRRRIPPRLIVLRLFKRKHDIDSLYQNIHH